VLVARYKDTPGLYSVPQYNLGGTVAVDLLLARTPTTAVIVRHDSAEPRGIGFELIVRLREPMRDLDKHMGRLMYSVDDGDPTFLYVEVRFSDGRLFTPPRGVPGERGRVLESAGGGGQYETWGQDLWVPALPQSGTVTFACSWETRSIRDATATLDARDILAAADRAEPLFG
jgi:hypothetical protein